MKNHRIYRIMIYCMRKNDIVTLKELSDYMNVSVATIRLDMSKIEQLAKECDVTLIRKRGVGYQIKGVEEDINRAIKHMEQILHKGEKNGYDDVENCIIFYLLQHLNQYVHMSDLANMYYVSNCYYSQPR